MPEQLIAGAAAFAFFFLAAWLYPRGMGMGDVKLAGMLGLYLGRAVAPAIFIALILGVVVGAVVIARLGQKAGRKTAVPFGPFLAIGGIDRLLRRRRHRWTRTSTASSPERGFAHARVGPSEKRLDEKWTGDFRGSAAGR